MMSILKKLRNGEILSFNESFLLSKVISKELNTEKASIARKFLIYVLDNFFKIPEPTKDIWINLFEAAGFYPYLAKEKLTLNSTDSIIRAEFHKSSNISSIYFHDEQAILLEILNNKKNLIVSAPTSFGKSLLIEEIIASRKYKNIVVIQPTLALLDETRKKLSKYKNHYKIIVKTTQEPDIQMGNIFLLTAERVMEYKKFPNIDFLCLDEFYKLSSLRDDERADTLNNAFYFIIKRFNPQFYLLGPNIDGISKGFAEKYGAVFYKTDYSLVVNESNDFYSKYKDEYGKKGKKKLFKEQKLFELLDSLKREQTIIYCSSPNRARYLAKKYYEHSLQNNVKMENNLPLIEWIENFVSPDWCMVNLLKAKIAFHDGALQKHISSSIIDYFNKDLINYLFCTSTIIEGVNTSAKNVIYYDDKKGKDSPIDFFDYSNIKGRAGRLMEHYVGRIFYFNQLPPRENVTVDIQFFEQTNICDEVLINIEKEDLQTRSKTQAEKFELIPEKERILYKNNGINIKGQQKLLQDLDMSFERNYHLLCWKGFPTYEQFKFTLELAWNYLAKDSDKSKGITINRLICLTYKYGINKNIWELVENQYAYDRKLERNKDKSDNELKDDAILLTFNILKHWFQYKIPKWLMVISNIQEYLCEKRSIEPGNYTFYANGLENDFIRENLTLLSEFGIPRTAIEKLSTHISANVSEDMVFELVKKIYEDNKLNLLQYEKEKIRESYL